MRKQLQIVKTEHTELFSFEELKRVNLYLIIRERIASKK